MAKTIAYLRVSTNEQDLNNQKLEILEYARKNNFSIDDFIEIKMSSRKPTKARLIEDLMAILDPGDTLIVSELSRLGRSVGQVVTMVDELAKRHVKLICIKENIRLNGNGRKDLQSTVLISMFSLLAEIEHTLISERTRSGMAAAKAKGVTLGRPKGPGKSKLDEHRDKIVSELKLGVPKTRIAKRYGSSLPNFHHWLKTRKIEVREVEHD